jgi:regulator of protease activity HflC (stomatin/prohibitin superfamily)
MTMGSAMNDRPYRGASGGSSLRRLLWIAPVVLLALLIANPLVTVGVGQRAVLFSLAGGTLSRQLGEGTHVVVPFVQRAVFYDVRTQTYTMSEVNWEGEVHGDDSLTALTSDGQEVKIDISVRFHPDAAKIWRLHQRIGPDYVSKIIRPEIRSQVRIAIAEFPVGDVYSSKRELVQEKISERLSKSLRENDILVDEVLLRNVQFSPAYAAAIEQKQIAQQNAQRMQYVLQKAELEKRQKILEAQGDARSIQLRGRAIAQSARVVEYEYARKIAPNVSAIITDGRTITARFSAHPEGASGQ